jgi:hypothetical protein
MKLVTGIVASLVIGSLSFGAFAAKEIQVLTTQLIRFLRQIALRVHRRRGTGSRDATDLGQIFAVVDYFVFAAAN